MTWGVLEWHTVTVASAFSRRYETGLPTISLRPRTTALFPRTSTLDSSRSSMTPFGVQGIKYGFPLRFASSPTLIVWKPSTSLKGDTAEVMAGSKMFFGKGNWTRIPWTAGSAFRCSIAESSYRKVNNRSHDTKLAYLLLGDWFRENLVRKFNIRLLGKKSVPTLPGRRERKSWITSCAALPFMRT